MVTLITAVALFYNIVAYSLHCIKLGRFVYFEKLRKNQLP